MLAVPSFAARLATDPAVDLLIEGVVDDHGRTVATLDPHGEGTRVEGGTVDSLGLRVPRSGKLVRLARGGGAFMVWTFRATVVHDLGTVRLEIEGTGEQDLDLRMARGTQTAWAGAKDGVTVPRFASAILHPAMAGGQSLIFQLAVLIRDQQPPAMLRPAVNVVAIPNGPRREMERRALPDLLRRQRSRLLPPWMRP